MAEDMGEPDVKIAIVAGDFGVGKFLLQFGDEAVGFAELNGTDAFAGRRKQDLAEIAFADRVADREPFAAVTVGEWSHAQLRRRSFVDTARRRVPGSIQGMSDIRAFLHLMLEGLESQRVCVFARGDTQQLLEAAQQMGGAERDGIRQFRQ
jgi:hypothetical protein